MDDVDRLFQCFKCGITPPQSAVREKRKEKRKLKQEEHSPKLQASTISENKSVNLKTGKQFSPVIFYGSPHGVPPKKPARLLRLLREIRVDLAEQSKLREEIWTTFPRQDEAMKFAKQHSNAHVFSYQDHMNGQRRFLVSTFKEFWQRYKHMNSKFRHHYEVIQEGMPCHLYFDLEFNKKENADRNGDEMVDLLLSVVFDALLEKYSIQRTKDFVVELDSSTEDKFSRHLIIRYRRLHSKTTLMLVHLSLRNRCFRLPFSSKAGKNSFLLPSGRFNCKDMGEEEVFMASLICNMDADCDKLLICKMDVDCVKALHFETEMTDDIQKQPGGPIKFDLDACMNDASRTNSTGKSPFPALDVFIEAIASSGNVPGKIRSWYWFSEYGLMVYSMSRNRYCERIGREHKSNHVIYVVDLRRGDYYQKCHDPDCRGYRSPLRPLPDEVIPGPNFLFNPTGESNDQEHTNPVGNDRLTDSCIKEEWWHEAIKVADEVEKIQKALDLTQMEETCEEDENWWMAVENTAKETELAYLQKG